MVYYPEMAYYPEHRGFTILTALTPDGSWLAFREHNPKFCFQGETEREAVGTAERALDFYLDTLAERERTLDDIETKNPYKE